MATLGGTTLVKGWHVHVYTPPGAIICWLRLGRARMVSNGRGAPDQRLRYHSSTRASRRWPSWRASVSPRRFESFPLRSYIPGLSTDNAAPLPLFTPSCREGVLPETQRAKGHKKEAGALPLLPY